MSMTSFPPSVPIHNLFYLSKRSFSKKRKKKEFFMLPAGGRIRHNSTQKGEIETCLQYPLLFKQ